MDKVRLAFALQFPSHEGIMTQKNSSNENNCRRRGPRKYDAEATKRIIAEHGQIVRFIAHKLAHSLPASVDVDDLINVGLVGLMDAAERFDAKRGFKFQTFAEFRIRGAMIDELRRQDWVPRGARERSKDYRAFCEKFREEKDREPTQAEVAKGMGLSAKKISELEQIGGNAQLVHSEDLGPNAFSELTDEIEIDFSPFAVANQKDMRKALEGVLHRLPEREQAVLSYYYFQDLSLKEIGAKMGITESRVSQLHSRALTLLKEIVHQSTEEEDELKRLLA